VNLAAGAILAGLGIVVVLAVWPAAKDTPPSAAPATRAQTPTVEPAARDVTPPGIVPGPTVEGPLTRLEVAAAPPPPARWHRFFRPLIIEAGLFEAKGKSIRLSGLQALPADALCTSNDGAEWPCGRAALNELRRLIRGRAIECNFSSGEAEKVLVVPCRVAKTDLAVWLAAQGWARASSEASSEIRDAARAAACTKRGIWRDQVAEEPCA
jgi:endonuclease YncB( thermonuclease family)